MMGGPICASTLRVVSIPLIDTIFVVWTIPPPVYTIGSGSSGSSCFTSVTGSYEVPVGQFSSASV